VVLVMGRLGSFGLGELLRWEKSRLSRYLGRMQTCGPVTRERCETGQRGAVVAITPEGSRLIEAARDDAASGFARPAPWWPTRRGGFLW
jgi:DNA-binding MarR family transcriptional regulator